MARTKAYWTDQQDPGDYQAAEEFLCFTTEPTDAREIVDRMRGAPVVYRLPADVLRVAALSVLGEDSIHIVKVLDQVRRNRLLTPVLIVRGGGGIAIADGYFRICAGIYLNEPALIPCRMVSRDPPAAP